MEPRFVDGLRTATNGGYAPGHERFEREVATALDRRVTSGKPGRPVKLKPEIDGQASLLLE